MHDRRGANAKRPIRSCRERCRATDVAVRGTWKVPRSRRRWTYDSAVLSLVALALSAAALLWTTFVWSFDRRTRIEVVGVIAVDLFGDGGAEVSVMARAINRSRHPVRVVRAGWTSSRKERSVVGRERPDLVSAANGGADLVVRQVPAGTHAAGLPLAEAPARFWVQLADGTVVWSRRGFHAEGPGVSEPNAPDSPPLFGRRYRRADTWLEELLQRWLGAERDRLSGTNEIEESVSR